MSLAFGLVRAWPQKYLGLGQVDRSRTKKRTKRVGVRVSFFPSFQLFFFFFSFQGVEGTGDKNYPTFFISLINLHLPSITYPFFKPVASHSFTLLARFPSYIPPCCHFLFFFFVFVCYCPETYVNTIPQPPPWTRMTSQSRAPPIRIQPKNASTLAPVTVGDADSVSSLLETIPRDSFEQSLASQKSIPSSISLSSAVSTEPGASVQLRVSIAVDSEQHYEKLVKAKVHIVLVLTALVQLPNQRIWIEQGRTELMSLPKVIRSRGLETTNTKHIQSRYLSDFFFVFDLVSQTTRRHFLSLGNLAGSSGRALCQDALASDPRQLSGHWLHTARGTTFWNQSQGHCTLSWLGWIHSMG